MEDAKEVVCVDFNTNMFFLHIFWADIYPSYRYVVSHEHNKNDRYRTTVVIANY